MRCPGWKLSPARSAGARAAAARPAEPAGARARAPGGSQCERQQPRRRRLERRDHRLPLAEPEPLHGCRRHLGDERPDGDAGAVAERRDPSDRRPDVVDGRVVGDAVGQGDLPRIDGQGDPARKDVRGPHRPARVEGHLGQPVGLAEHHPGNEIRTGEPGDERVDGRGHELGRRPQLSEPAVDENADAVSERRRVLEVVGDEDHRQPERGEEVSELTAHGGARVRVERGERLVQEEGPRLACESTRHGDTLALAAGDLQGARISDVGDPEPLEQAVDAPPVGCAERDVAAHAQVREERVVLEDEADRPPFRRDVHPARRVEPGLLPEEDTTPRGPQEPGDHAQDARLPGPRRADQGERLRSDLEPQLEIERAEGVGKICVEDRHDGTSLTARSRTALAATSSAPIASAVSKSTSNCS